VVTSPAPYLPRPRLTTEQWQRVFVLVEAAEDAGDIDDPAVAEAVAFFRSKKFANAPETGSFVGIANALVGAHALATGHRCGNYALVEPIGRGGMGSVWRAQRIDGLYEQDVAVKLLGSLALSSQARARFAREGELLARLSHPNIARLIDAGVTADGQRYLVLDWVRGVDIRTYCNDKSVREILCLFRQLLSAVAFAHAQLILHRDIKPGNVLVDDSGQVKLLDFGVAKWLVEDQHAADIESLTRMAGAAYTEAYAAPEQVLDLPVGVAADVFSLGSLLIELLTRERIEWSIPKRQWQNADRSVRLITSVANLPRDLRMIVEKAVLPLAENRYASVAEFDEDLRRFLDEEPIRARTLSRRYVLTKFVARHRAAVAFGSLAVAATVSSLFFALYQLREAREHERLSSVEAAKANAISNFTTSLFTVLDPKVASPIDRSKLTAKQILDMGRERIRTELHDQPETRLALLGTLAEMYGRLEFESEFESLNNERIALARERFGEHHPVVYDARTTEYWSDIYRGNYAKANAIITALDADANARGERGERGDERAAIRLHGLAEIQSLSAAESGAALLARYRAALSAFEYAQSVSPEHAAAIANYGNAFLRVSDPGNALVQYDRALAMMEHARESKSYVINEGDVFLSLRGRGKALQALNRSAEAEIAFRRAIDLSEKSSGAAHVLTKQLRGDLAHLLHTMNRRDEAWREMAAIDATRMPQTSNTTGLDHVRVLRARMLLAESKRDEARELVIASIDSWRKAGNNPLRLREAETLLAEIDAAQSEKANQSPNR
jgi:eukaryotic-like serine/threonine-protein kinase